MTDGGAVRRWRRLDLNMHSSSARTTVTGLASERGELSRSRLDMSVALLVRDELPTGASSRPPDVTSCNSLGFQRIHLTGECGMTPGVNCSPPENPGT